MLESQASFLVASARSRLRLLGGDIRGSSSLYFPRLRRRISHRRSGGGLRLVSASRHLCGRFVTQAASQAHDVPFIRRAERTWRFRWTCGTRSGKRLCYRAYYIPLDIGPTRHGITHGQTIYFFDPAGNRNEVFSGGFIYYPDTPKRVWSMDQIGNAIFYYQRELNARFMSVVT